MHEVCYEQLSHSSRTDCTIQAELTVLFCLLQHILNKVSRLVCPFNIFILPAFSFQAIKCKRQCPSYHQIIFSPIFAHPLKSMFSNYFSLHFCIIYNLLDPKAWLHFCDSSFIFDKIINILADAVVIAFSAPIILSPLNKLPSCCPA